MSFNIEKLFVILLLIIFLICILMTQILYIDKIGKSFWLSVTAPGIRGKYEQNKILRTWNDIIFYQHLILKITFLIYILPNLIIQHTIVREKLEKLYSQIGYLMKMNQNVIFCWEYAPFQSTNGLEMWPEKLGYNLYQKTFAISSYMTDQNTFRKRRLMMASLWIQLIKEEL